MATEEMDSSVELNRSQQMEDSSPEENIESKESSEEMGICRMCAKHGMGVDMLLEQHSAIRNIAKHYLKLEVHNFSLEKPLCQFVL